MKVNPVPEGFHSVTPFLHVEDAVNLINFLVHAFDARVRHTTTLADGSLINANLIIGDSIIEISQVRGDFQPMPAALHLYVEDVDSLYQKAVELGGLSVAEPADQLYGDREAFIIDPAGNHWYLATRIENLTTEEINRRMNQLDSQF